MPNTVVKLTNAESTWLEAAREDRKLLINTKAHLQRCAFFLLSFGSGFKVQGSRFRVEVAAVPPFLLGDARKWYLSHQSLLRYEGRNRLTCMVSDTSAQSPLVLAGAFHT